MTLLKENLLAQFSVTSLVIMTILGVTVGIILTAQLDANIELLREHGAAMMSGRMIQPTDQFSIQSLAGNVRDLQLITLAAVGAAFVGLYASLVVIVWRGWSTITSQRQALLKANEDHQAVNANLQALNQELYDAQQKLVRSERLAAIGQLSAGVAHELRNPLGGIKNAVYYIKGKVRDSDLAKENPRIVQFLDIMDEEIASSNQIITDLMDFARVNPPELSPTNLESLLDNAILRMEIKETVKISKSFDPDVPEVPADADQLRRMLSNLIKNADDAMPEGGEVMITASAPNGFVELKVSDTGEGIADPNLNKVFDPLFTTKTKGIGLGLAIVGEVVRKHHGSIDVMSQPGEGTTFTIKLPKNGAPRIPGLATGE